MSDRASTKFESWVPFSNGIAELTLKKPPPLVPSCLIAIWEATGPSGQGLVGALERGGGDRVAEGLQHALGDQDQADDDRQRQQDVVEAANQVLPEVPEPVAAADDDAADQSHQRADADGRGDEVLHRQPRHLGEVAERRLAPVVLPVGVGDERRRGVEAHVPGPESNPAGLNGWIPWVRRIRYSASQEKSEKAIRSRA